MGQPAGRGLRIYPGNGVDGLRASYVAHGAVGATGQLGVGSLGQRRGPGQPLPRGQQAQGAARQRPRRSDRLGDTVPSLDLTGYDWVLSPGDVNRDGRADLVVREKATGYLWLLAGTTGGYRPRQFLAEGYGGYDLAG